MEDIERQMEEIRAAARKRVRDDFARSAAMAGPPALTLIAGLAAFQFMDLHAPNFKFAYLAIGGGSAWLAASLWLLAFLKRKRAAEECGLRAVAFSSWLEGMADGSPFRCKLPGFIKSGEESFGFAMELELPLAGRAAPLVLYRRLRAEFLRGDPYVLTEPGALAARLARAFQ